jgi:glutamate carboxypeptidase
MAAHPIDAYLSDHLEEITIFLEQMVRLETPSLDPDAQAPMRQLLTAALESVDFEVRHIRGKRSGGHLFAVPKRRSRGRPTQLLLGHCDTVWPVGTLGTMPLITEHGIMKGPGVYDMKAGLVQMIYVLKALRDLGLEPPLTPLVFINSDEEVGSRESTRTVRRLACIVSRCFVLEPSLDVDGKLKTARKGVGRFTVTIRGRAAHAGLNPEAGASAILELSHVIQKLFGLNDPEKGVTVNVGMIDGGLRANVIAPQSSALVDVRVLTREDARRIEETILSLEAETPGVTLEIEGRIGRPPMERTPANRALWNRALDLAHSLDLPLQEGVAGGASDGNTTSLFTATLDGLGAVGDGAHAVHEYVELSRIPERGALLGLLLLSPLSDDRS